MKNCADVVGAEVLGLQTEMDTNTCDDRELRSNLLNSSNVERMVVSTFGSFIAESLADWSEQIVQLGKEA